VTRCNQLSGRETYTYKKVLKTLTPLYNSAVQRLEPRRGEDPPCFVSSNPIPISMPITLPPPPCFFYSFRFSCFQKFFSGILCLFTGQSISELLNIFKMKSFLQYLLETPDSQKDIKVPKPKKEPRLVVVGGVLQQWRNYRKLKGKTNWWANRPTEKGTRPNPPTTTIKADRKTNKKL
jgi:hypothetical protein